MAATRRLNKELKEIEGECKSSTELEFLDEIRLKDNNCILHWTAVIKPEGPYKDGHFEIQLNFPTEYPFKPPGVQFTTKIYHPNVAENGQVCLPVISPENWKPATKIKQVLICLICLVNKPEPDHPLRSDIAKEYMTDRNTFNKKAQEHTIKNALKKEAL